MIYNPSFCAADTMGQIYVTDSSRVIKFNQTESLFVLAGSIIDQDDIDGNQAVSRLGNPQGLAVNSINSNIIYIIDTDYAKIKLLNVTNNINVITTVYTGLSFYIFDLVVNNNASFIYFTSSSTSTIYQLNTKTWVGVIFAGF